MDAKKETKRGCLGWDWWDSVAWGERCWETKRARAQYIRVITICRGSRDQYQPEVGSANADNPYCWCPPLVRLPRTNTILFQNFECGSDECERCSCDRKFPLEHLRDSGANLNDCRNHVKGFSVFRRISREECEKILMGKSICFDRKRFHRNSE